MTVYTERAYRNNYALFFLYLIKSEFQRCLTTEDLHHHLQLTLLGVHLLNHATETVERTVGHLHGIINIIRNGGILIADDRLLGSTQYPVDIGLTYRGWT